ncbi:MAG: hypothetical protein WBG34_01800, partial [Flavobacteriales bacterium]
FHVHGAVATGAHHHRCAIAFDQCVPFAAFQELETIRCGHIDVYQKKVRLVLGIAQMFNRFRRIKERGKATSESGFLQHHPRDQMVVIFIIHQHDMH